MTLKKIFLSLNTLLLAGALTGCTDETLFQDAPDYTVSGEPVTVTLQVSVPQMDVKTRTDLGYEERNHVTSIWVRTYSSYSGEATSDWLKETPDVNQAELDYGPLNITLNTHSGLNYIVAVANVDNLGVTKDDLANPKPLSELLDAADTWQDFLNIAVLSPSDNEDTYAPETPMPMAGCYTNVVSGGVHHAIDQWQTENFQSYFIPASHQTIELTNGVIHLRRLVSQINFNITPVNSDLTVTVNSYSIFNAPKYSWLYERSGSDGMQPNFGDNATEQTIADYFADVPAFGSQYVSVDRDGVSTFDFWQAENKHTGTAQSYQDRDKENDYNATVPVFTSLSGSSWTPNDMASYVKISCTVEYKGTLRVNEQGEVVNANGEVVHRVGYADYYIHLGYLNNDAADFNCFRNVKYIYNVGINGVDDIRVDAFAEGELTYPGEAGIVTDLTTSNISLDCHYHTFNISLTAEDLDYESEGRNAFGFLITTYKSGNQYIFDEDTDFSKVEDRHLYNWIELKRVSTETDYANLAAYSPSYNLANDVEGHEFLEDETFLITELNARLKAGKLTPGTYTVFVNEYTYEPMFGESDYGDETAKNGSPNWMTYVNQDPRRFFIKVNQKKSPDGNRIYARSKYGIIQRSMQTYYNTISLSSLNAGKNAIAAERENEIEGLNMRAIGNNNQSGTGVSYTSYGTSDTNGRYNLAQYFSKSNTNISVLSANVNSRPSWSSFVDVTAPQQRPGVSGLRTQKGPEISERTIANGDPIRMTRLASYSGTRTASFSDPYDGTEAQYYIETYNACSNRNRDNNGNGRIDPEEVRWYIPSMGDYLRLLIGSNSLSQPLMRFTNVSGLPRANSDNKGTVSTWVEAGGYIVNDFCSRYMFFTSNGSQVLWALEGMSTSTWAAVCNDWSGGKTHPWQVRCIRNLGTNLQNIVSAGQIEMAYKVENNIVTFSYYDLASIRFARYTGNGNGNTLMPVHTIPNTYNNVYRSFEIDSQDLTDVNKDDLVEYINGNPCSSRNEATGKTGWRIPNQKELAIIHNIGGILTGNAAYLSCTANYFNSSTGLGIDASGTNVPSSNYFLAFLGTAAENGDRGTQLTPNNLGYNVRVRCVRDN